MEYALEVKNLTKKYDSFTLDNVNISLPKGSIMGFIGENGAGKSTTIKLLLNLIHKDSGEIKLFGIDNLKNEKLIKEQIGVVFDECNFPQNLKTNDVNQIMKNIYKNWDTNLFNSYLTKFNLSNNKTIKEFSRGMKMKLLISVALSHHPKLLILDEATSGLDPIVRDEILDVFLEFIQDEDHSIFISSHITSDLDKIADYITFINNGKIVFSEQKDEMFDKYGMLKCSISDFENIDKSAVIRYKKNSFGVEALVLKNKLKGKHIIDSATIEDIMLFHIRGEK